MNLNEKRLKAAKKDLIHILTLIKVFEVYCYACIFYTYQ